MPYTSHGHWYGHHEAPSHLPPRYPCGGPHLCVQCAIEAHREGEDVTAPRVAGKLGKKAPDPSKPRLRLAPHLDTAVPPNPAVVDWLSRVQAWPMLKNDVVGDCVFAACGHMAMAWGLYGAGKTFTITDYDVIKAYSDVTGYNPNDPSTDQGTVVQDALAYWRKTGIAGHKILAYAQVDHRNQTEVDAAINIFGALMVGVRFPRSAMDQFNAGQPWAVVNPDGGIDGGHAVHLGYFSTPDRDTHVVTWGDVQQVDNDWLASYCDEIWVPITPEWLDATGRSPAGLDLHGLGEDFAALTGQPNPFPAPSPAPPPTPNPGPQPTPTPPPNPSPGPVVDAADKTFAAKLRPWVQGWHPWNHTLKTAAQAWLRAKGL